MRTLKFRSLLLVVILVATVIRDSDGHMAGCLGTLHMDHSLARTTPALSVVRNPIVGLDTLKACSEEWHTTAAAITETLRDGVCLERAILDGGVVVYHGPSRACVRALHRAADPDPQRYLALASVLFALAAAAVLSYGIVAQHVLTSRIKVTSGGLLVVALALYVPIAFTHWKQPTFQALNHFEKAMKQRIHAAPLKTCLAQPAYSDASISVDHHWYSERECMCAWHSAAIAEVSASRTVRRSRDMDWFEQSSVFRRRATTHIRFPSQQLIQELDALYRTLDNHVSGVRRQRKDVLNNIARLERQLRKVRHATSIGAAELATTFNASFGAHTLAQVASDLVASELTSNLREQIKTLEMHLSQLDAKETHIRSEEQFPYVRRFWRKLAADANFVTWCNAALHTNNNSV